MKAGENRKGKGSKGTGEEVREVDKLIRNFEIKIGSQEQVSR